MVPLFYFQSTSVYSSYDSLSYYFLSFHCCVLSTYKFYDYWYIYNHLHRIIYAFYFFHFFYASLFLLSWVFWLNEFISVINISFSTDENWKKTNCHRISLSSNQTMSLLLWMSNPLTCFRRMLNRFPFSKVHSSSNSVL